MPIPFGRFDVAAVVTGVIALLLWTIMPTARLAAAALCFAGAFHLVRLFRWAGERTFPDRLVLILHIGYAFVPVGYLSTALAALELVASSAGIHAWTAGAIGTMTLAVMTRASLGHTGQALSASFGTQAIYLAVVIAALTRVSASVVTAYSELLMLVAGAAWSFAFLGFAVIYGPLLCTARK